jgi:iron complex transport system ATP-binding protein
MNEPILQMENISFSYRTTGWKLKIPHFSASRGEFTGIIGPNGSGKSTLLKLATGIFCPDSGSIKVKSLDIGSLGRKELAKFAGYLPQNISGGEDLTVWHVVSLGRYAHLRGAGFLSNEGIHAIEEAMEMTSTTEFAGRLFGSLSGGEKKRVLLASVLAQEPEILFLDEPESSLDPHQKSVIFGILERLAGEGMTVIVSVHDIALACSFCRNIIAMKKGSVIGRIIPQDLLDSGILEDLYHGAITASVHPSKDAIMINYTSKGGNR